jgi:hypothetical protein
LLLQISFPPPLPSEEEEKKFEEAMDNPNW